MPKKQIVESAASYEQQSQLSVDGSSGQKANLINDAYRCGSASHSDWDADLSEEKQLAELQLDVTIEDDSTKPKKQFACRRCQASPKAEQ